MDAKVALAIAFLITIPALAVMGVGRAGLHNFVRWHRLNLPDEWAAPVTRYLRTARRFRIWGLVAEAVVLIPWQVAEQRIGVDFLAASAGWLIGGVLLELRLGRRGAVPVAPHPLPRWLRATPAVLAGLSVLLTGLCLWTRPPAAFAVAAFGLGGLVASSLVAATVWHVTRRAALPGVTVEVDRAVRDRAATGLTAVGALVVAQCLSRQADRVAEQLAGATQEAVQEAGWLLVFGGLLLALCTWWATPPVRRGLVPIVVGAALVISTAGWVGAGVARDVPPYGPEAVQATARLRYVTPESWEADVVAFDMVWSGRRSPGAFAEEFRHLIGRVELTVPPHSPPGGHYNVLLIDTRADTTVTAYGEAGALWGNELYRLANRYSWLSAVPRDRVPGPNDEPKLIRPEADYPEAITFYNDFGIADAPRLADLAVVLIFTGPQQQIYWATRVPVTVL
ncbi:hypothetical protein CS0771_19590 [Catellatospora sp. IY07-71]|uniref:hypothetical protein n=1 Tax=Catellatospora sp. IY07-71 TaxID=2728827 RepID=UPI001BB4198A|nr:hypothetical protein [Catellatospora sp. IY07-71]BCJ72415.1 hypothetical protein CS0771_19590 [Catellatospora sp. IY07-71]